MKKALAGLLVLLIAVAVLLAIIARAPYLAEKNDKQPDRPAPLTDAEPGESLDRSRQPQGADAPLSFARPESLAMPPADAPAGRDPATSVADTPETLPVVVVPATGESAEPEENEVFGLLTDTGETEENQILDPQSMQTTMIAPGQRAQPAKKAAPRQRDKGQGDQAITVVPEGTYPFAVLLETYDKQASAEHAAALCRRQNLACYWVKVDLGTPGVKYRLFTGFFPTRAAAQTALARHRLAGRPVKQTMYAARVGIFQDNHELAAAYAKTVAAGASPYILGTARGRYFLYAGAFYTAGGAETQCRDLAAQGLPCQPAVRSTLPLAVP